MDPSTGKLYPSVEDAILAGVKNPIELLGEALVIEELSGIVRKYRNAEQRRENDRKRVKAKAARKARRQNRK